MADENPFANDAVLGDVWEQGYLAGFAQPEEDHLPPLAPEVLDVYQQGEQAGRDDRRLLPPEGGGFDGQTEPSAMVEVAEEVGISALSHIVLDHIFGTVGGLIAVVIEVVQIPGDVQLHPLEPDWSGPVDQPEDTYIAMCPRTDHSVFVEGAIDGGYWTGPGRESYADALDDWFAHSHAEAFVARCSLPEGTCGPVWPGQGP
jgi:hypothetical protein